LDKRVINNGESHAVWPSLKEYMDGYWCKIAVLTMRQDLK